MIIATALALAGAVILSQDDSDAAAPEICSVYLHHAPDGEPVSTIEVVKGNFVADTTDFYPMMIDGKYFIGWYTDKDLTKRFSIDTAINEDTHLYAKTMDLATQYALTLCNGSNIIDVIVVEKNAKAPTLPTPFKDGYKFKGWYHQIPETDPETGVSQYVQFKNGSIVDNNYNLYAGWEKGLSLDGLFGISAIVWVLLIAAVLIIIAAAYLEMPRLIGASIALVVLAFAIHFGFVDSLLDKIRGP